MTDQERRENEQILQKAEQAAEKGTDPRMSLFVQEMRKMLEDEDSD